MEEQVCASCTKRCYGLHHGKRYHRVDLFRVLKKKIADPLPTSKVGGRFISCTGGQPRRNTNEDKMSNAIANLEDLNRFDNPEAFSGNVLSTDGQGNSLWIFGDKVANRFCEIEGCEAFWSDEIEGWGYSEEDALS